MTFAIIEAQAMERLFLSPLVIPLFSIAKSGMAKPSTSAKSGLTLSFAIAFFIAKNEAFRILIWSIFLLLTMPMPRLMAPDLIFGKSKERWRGVSSLESLTPLSLMFLGKMTAAATTGPASEPLPTSSTPQKTRLLYFHRFWSRFFLNPVFF